MNAEAGSSKKTLPSLISEQTVAWKGEMFEVSTYTNLIMIPIPAKRSPTDHPIGIMTALYQDQRSKDKQLKRGNRKSKAAITVFEMLAKQKRLQ